MCSTNKSADAFELRKDTGKLRNICRKCHYKQRLDKQNGVVKSAEELQIIAQSKAAKKKQKKSCDAKKYREKNRDRVQAAKKRYYETNKEKVLGTQRERYLQNKEKINARNSQWKRNNKGAVLSSIRARQTRKANALSSWANKEMMTAIYQRAVRFEQWLGTKFHVDHIIPLVHPLVCGLHNEFNLQILKKEDNLRKSNKFNPADFEITYNEGAEHAD